MARPAIFLFGEAKNYQRKRLTAALNINLAINPKMATFAIMAKTLSKLLVAATLAVIAVGSGLLDFFLPAMGDDLEFWNHLGLDGYVRPDRSTVSFILAHLTGCNGRLFDFMGPIVVNLLPDAAAAALMGAMAALFFYSVLFAGRIPCSGNHTALAMTVITATLAAMPWWDSLFLRVCQFNYLWASTFCLLFFGLFFAAPKKGPDSTGRKLMLAAVGFFASASHEQTAVAMCAAFMLWLLINRNYKSLDSRQKLMLGALGAGALLPLGAPAIWLRAAGSHARQPLGLLLTTTYPLLGVLLALMATLALIPRTRSYLFRQMANGGWTPVAAALIAACIGVFSGIPGRTGMLSEALSIVVLARMAVDSGIRIRRSAAAAISAATFMAIAAHFSAAVADQRRQGREYDDVVELYRSSADGIVFYDFAGRYDVSPLTLNRVKGVADADDYWNLQAIAKAYGTPGRLPVVLPAAFSDKLHALTDSVTDGSTTVYAFKPDNVVVTLDDVVLQNYPGPAPRAVSHTRMADGREIWVASPRVRDPGDYSLPVKSRL